MGAAGFGIFATYGKFNPQIPEGAENYVKSLKLYENDPKLYKENTQKLIRECIIEEKKVTPSDNFVKFVASEFLFRVNFLVSNNIYTMDNRTNKEAFFEHRYAAEAKLADMRSKLMRNSGSRYKKIKYYVYDYKWKMNLSYCVTDKMIENKAVNKM